MFSSDSLDRADYQGKSRHHRLGCERDKWDKFVEKCLANNSNPDLANSNLIQVNMAARQRILVLSKQLDDVARNGPRPSGDPTPRVPVKMPPIALPTFDGKRENWTNFWTLF